MAEALWLLFAANFNLGFLWGGDAQVPYTFLRRLFGAQVNAVGYQFGLAFFEAPFYGAGKALQQAGIETIRTHPVSETFTAFGAAVYGGIALAVAYALLRAMRVRWPALAAALAFFGSPIFYYGTFSPGQTHAVDTLLATLLMGIVFAGFRHAWTLKLASAAGVIVGLATSVRYFEAALGGGLFLVLLITRRAGAALVLACAAAASFGLLYAVPTALGVDVFGGGRNYTPQVITWSPESPIHMLFSVKRGLFLWTPLTALAVVGYVALLRQRRDLRPFLSTLGVMAICVICSYALIPFWDAGWSFSQRYFTALFPAYAVGIAGLLELRFRLASAASAAAVAWTMFLCLSMQTLSTDYRGPGIDRLVQLAGRQSPGAYANAVYHISHLRVLIPYNPFRGTKPR